MSTRMKWVIVFILSLTMAGCNPLKKAGTKENGNSNAGKNKVQDQVPDESPSPDASLDDTNQEQENQKSKIQNNKDSADADKTQDDQKTVDITQTDQKAAKKSKSSQIGDKESAGTKKTIGETKVQKKSDGSAQTKKEPNNVNLSYYEDFLYAGDYIKMQCSVGFHSAKDDQIRFSLCEKNEDETFLDETSLVEECLGTLHGDKVDFEFIGTEGKDSVNYDERTRDKGGGTLRFDGDDILVKAIVERKGSEVCHIAYPEYRIYREEYTGKTDYTYILSDSSSRYLTEKDLEGISKENLSYARNEIYARHQYIFRNPRYGSYFCKKGWYADEEDQDVLPYGSLNDYEVKNIKLIQEAESK